MADVTSGSDNTYSPVTEERADYSESGYYVLNGDGEYITIAAARTAGLIPETATTFDSIVALMPIFKSIQ